MRMLTIVLTGLLIAACGSSSGGTGGGSGGSGGGGTGGGSGGGSGGGNSNGDDNPDIYKNAATGTLSGDLTGTFAHSYLMIASHPSVPPPVAVSVAAYSDNDATGGIALTAPSGASVLQVINSLGFTSTPSTGTTYDQTNASLCGGLAIQLTTGVAYEVIMPKACDGSTNTAAGTMSLKFTSLTQLTQNNPGLATFSKASGTFTAHLAPQGSGAGVDVSLSF